MSGIDSRPPVKRYEHGSRVPGWDEAVDLTKPPATVPDPALTPVPEELRTAIEAEMAKYPDSKSASIPALHLAQKHHGWCSPEAIAQVACVMRLTPGLPDLGGELLRHVLPAAEARRTTSSSAPTSPARCSAPTSSDRAR